MARRQRRVKFALPVKIWTEEGNGSVIQAAACTLDASLNGVRLQTSALRKIGQVVTLGYGTRRARFRVAWIGDPNGNRPHEVGLENVDGKVLFHHLEQDEEQAGQYVDREVHNRRSRQAECLAVAD